MSDEPKKKVEKIVKVTAEDRKWVQKMRQMNMGDREIAIALNIPEDHPLISERQ